MNEELVSVIIPCYQAQNYIYDTVKSVLAQDYRFMEVIVIDDGSTDNSAREIQKIIDEGGVVKYFKQENRGVSQARNYGYVKASGDLLAFLDADDIWEQDNISLKVSYLNEHLDVGLVHSDAFIIDQDSEKTGGELSGQEGFLLDKLLLSEGTCVPAPSSILVRRKVIEEVGQFDPNLSTSADKDFFIRVSQKYKIGRVPQKTWRYRVHDANMHSNIALMEKDERYVYAKAVKAGLYKSEAFQRMCFARMCFVLSGSWWVVKKDLKKTAIYLIKSLYYNPVLFKELIRKI